MKDKLEKAYKLVRSAMPKDTDVDNHLIEVKVLCQRALDEINAAIQEVENIEDDLIFNRGVCHGNTTNKDF